MKTLLLTLILTLPTRQVLASEIQILSSNEDLGAVSVYELCVDGNVFLLVDRYQASFAHRATGIGAGTGITQVLIFDENKKNH